MGLIPNYQTVDSSGRNVRPLTARDKWGLFLRTTTDPFVIGDVVLGASLSHISRGIPDYGSNGEAYGKRLGAALADVTSQNALSGALYPALLHQDPRYFRLGPNHGTWQRVAYSVSRMAVTRTDRGKQAPNWSFFLGTATAVALSNAWYPAVDRNGSVMGARMMAIGVGSATGNLLPEFWPDIQHRVLPHVLPYLLLRFRNPAGRGVTAAQLSTGIVY